MKGILFIGDEVTAAGFRMAGLATRVPDAGDCARILSEELPRWRMILLATELVNTLPEAMVERLLQSVDPVVVLLPDLGGRAGALPLESRVQRELGIEEI